MPPVRSTSCTQQTVERTEDNKSERIFSSLSLFCSTLIPVAQIRVPQPPLLAILLLAATVSAAYTRVIFVNKATCFFITTSIMFISFYVFYAFTQRLQATTDTDERWRQTYSGKSTEKANRVCIPYVRTLRTVCLHSHARPRRRRRGPLPYLYINEYNLYVYLNGPNGKHKIRIKIRVKG